VIGRTPDKLAREWLRRNESYCATRHDGKRDRSEPKATRFGGPSVTEMPSHVLSLTDAQKSQLLKSRQTEAKEAPNPIAGVDFNLEGLFFRIRKVQERSTTIFGQLLVFAIRCTGKLKTGVRRACGHSTGHKQEDSC
jgi:hypothetical protein